MDSGFILALILAPFKFLFSLLRHKGMLFIVVIVVILVVVVPRFNQSKQPVPGETQKATYQVNHPQGTPIATPSKVYYAVEYTDDGKIITMTKFYDYNGKKWVLLKQPLQLDRAFVPVLIDK